MLALFLSQADFERIKPPIAFGVGNDRRSPYRFKVTNLTWEEGEDSVTIEAFAGTKRLARIVWEEPGFPNVYHAAARRQKPSGDILIAATCDGRLTQYAGVWLFSTKTKRLTLLNKAICNADDSHLSRGVVMEENVDRWIFHPPRNDSPDGWYHRTWTYDRKTQRLNHGSWRHGTLKRK